MNPNLLHAVTSKVIEAKRKVDEINYLIDSLKSEKINYCKVYLEFISKYRRSDTHISISKKEVLVLLKNRLTEAKKNLKIETQEFRKLM